MSSANDGMEEIIKEFLAESREDLDQLDRNLVALERDPSSRPRLDQIFRTVHTIKGAGSALGYSRLESIAHAGETLLSRLREGKLALNAAIISGLLTMGDALRRLLAAIEHDGNEGSGAGTEVLQLLGGLSSGVSAADGPTPAPHSAFAPPARLDSTGISASTIRVDVGLLDKMMALAGELVLLRNRVVQFAAHQGDPVLLGMAQRLKVVTTGLQESVMKARMQPVGRIWSTFPRLVRDLAMQCRKRVLLEMEGSEIELDRSILEAIKDPLTHIVRNSIDHGIEEPEERIKEGKAPDGHLRLRAFHEAGWVHLEVSDDGRGIALKPVRQRAVECGLCAPHQAAAMSETELANLVFTPGFSTVQKVTSFSGRGVGLDIVKTNIESIGGTVDLRSAPGKGTTLLLKVPLTVSILPALIVSSAGQRFAVPQVNITELVRLSDGQLASIETICEAPVYRLRERLLPLIFLDRALHLPTGPAGGHASYLAVVQVGASQFGLVVDAIHDAEEIVIKPLSRRFRPLMVFPGAAILADGQVALVLDMPAFARGAGIVANQALARQHTSPEQACHPPIARAGWLLCRGPAGTRIAVSLPSVACLEEISAGAIEWAAGQEVVQHRGEQIPLLYLSELLQQPRTASSRLPAVILRDQRRSVGLIVEAIDDITDEPLEVRRGPTGGWFEGSAIIRHKVTGILNVPSVLSRAGDGPLGTLSGRRP